MYDRQPRPLWLHWFCSSLIAALAWWATIGTLDPAGSYPQLREGPGITLDEVFNVEQGVILTEVIRSYGVGIVDPQSVHEIFGTSNFHYNPDHPPLGRLWIGVFHHLTRQWFPPVEADELLVTASARTAPATAFALTVLLVGMTAGRWYGLRAGVIASISLVMMPRVFGHAHIASLESFIGLTYGLTTFAVAHYWSRHAKAPNWKICGLTGILLGLALLTKIQAVLLPVPVVVWALFRWHWRGIRPLLFWGFIGLLVLLIGWPWLWLNPVEHLREYLGRTTGRVVIYVWYFGQRLADHDLPWHYPFLMFLVTVPIGLQLLGLAGTAAAFRSSATNADVPPTGLKKCLERWLSVARSREALLLGNILFVLIVFALPGVTVYDGVRLFLVVFPLWAVMIGRGGDLLLTWLRKRMSARLAYAGFLTLFAFQGYGLLAVEPCYLSYYNMLTGGLAGAHRIGLQTTYWGDSLTRSFWQEACEAVPAGSTVELVPVLHPFQLEDLQRQVPALRRHNITLRPLDQSPSAHVKYVMFFGRKADLPPWGQHSPGPPPGARLLAEVRRQHVQLAALYEIPPTAE